MAPSRELTPHGEKLGKVWEGEINYVYDDAYYPTRPYKRGTKIAGNLTAGVGHLLSRGSNIFPEAEKWIGKTIPQTQIDRWYDADTDIAEHAVNNLVKVKLAPNQWDTLYLFTFNVGVSAFAGSTLLKKLNANKLDAVPTELAKWNKTTINDKKVTSNGLKKRRALEIAYWLGGSVPVQPEDNNQPIATEIAERENQKLTPTEVIGGAGTILGGGAAFANSEGWINVGIGVAIVAAVILGGAIVAKRYIFTSR